MNTLWHIIRFAFGLSSPRKWGRIVRPLSGVVLLALGLWIGGTYLVQWWLVGRLAYRLNEASDVEAPRLVQELAKREARAYQAIVQAANSPRAAVALTARREVDLRVDRWQREAFLNPAAFDLRRTVLPLAQAFATTSPEMSPSARRWARQVVEQLAQFDQSQPIDVRLELFAHCDRALMRLPRDDQAAVLADAGAVSLPIMLGKNSLEARSQEATTVPNPPQAVEPAPQIVAAEAIPARQPQPGPQAETSEWQLAAPLANLGRQPSSGDGLPGREAAEAPMVPAQGVSLSRPAPLPREEVESAGEIPAERNEERLRWFEQLAKGNRADQARAQEWLSSAGYGQVRRDDALMLLSASIDDRKALVSRVLTSPRLEAAAWLEQLLFDRAPEVRAAAVAAIATSSDERLLKRAEEVALRDPAPVVADQLPLIRRQLR